MYSRKGWSGIGQRVCNEKCQALHICFCKVHRKVLFARRANLLYNVPRGNIVDFPGNVPHGQDIMWSCAYPVFAAEEDLTQIIWR